MIEFIFGAFTGYVLGQTLSKVNALLRRPDKILTWDSKSLGYRPVHPDTSISEGETYLLCYEVKSGNQER